MTQKYLIADEAAAYLNISRARFFDFRRFIPTFPKPVKTRLKWSTKTGHRVRVFPVSVF
ncbi:hypothetical protein [Klebsiella pneumoniae]|uniref:hypothetical protein n=1 Tax=Klebsiella pneumoniae TaxID=573 RepID=UPI001482583B|nr:hypothetical protein [Klebsiella pneumoniae]